MLREKDIVAGVAQTVPDDCEGLRRTACAEQKTRRCVADGRIAYLTSAVQLGLRLCVDWRQGAACAAGFAPRNSLRQAGTHLL